MPMVGQSNREAFARPMFPQKVDLSREAKGLVGESRLLDAPMRSPLEQYRATCVPGRPARHYARRLPLRFPLPQPVRAPAPGSRQTRRNGQPSAASAQFSHAARFAALQLVYAGENKTSACLLTLSIRFDDCG